MKTLFYDENTIELFRFLLQRTPERIVSDDHYCVVFDYGDFHVTAMPVGFAAASQNDSDEAIQAKFERVNSTFQPKEYNNVLFQRKAISRIWILRTFLYFTDHVIFKSEAEALGDLVIESELDKKIAELRRKSTGGHDIIVCHPESAEAEGVNKEFANLVDAGVMLEIDEKLLMCFSWNNGFWVVGRIMSPDELAEEIAPLYEFVEI